MIECKEFPKIPRLSRLCTITEKIDGTCGRIHIRLLGDLVPEFEFGFDTQVKTPGGEAAVRAGSKNRWLTHGGTGDNHGFGRWVMEHAHEVAALGIGEHFGEWWGLGIQRSYNQTRKRFSLFNTGRWRPRNDVALETVDFDLESGVFTDPDFGDAVPVPSCLDVVPVLATSVFTSAIATCALSVLRYGGSIAAPGFMEPEGIVIYHHALNGYFKKTLEKDEKPKGSKEPG